MPTPQEFYTGSHIRTLFREAGPFYSSFGHRGQDFAGWPEGTPIPAYRSGVVVADYFGTGLGNIVTLQYADSRYGGFCHMLHRSPFNVGDQVGAGDVIGWVGQTGSLSAGPHLHATLSGVSRYPETGAVENPLPYISAALGSTLSGTTGTIIEKKKEVDDMARPLYYVATSNNPSVTVGKDDVWVRSAPGEPLRRLTQGQWGDFYNRDRPDITGDINFRSGDWFDSAFREDVVVAGYNSSVHR